MCGPHLAIFIHQLPCLGHLSVLLHAHWRGTLLLLIQVQNPFVQNLCRFSPGLSPLFILSFQTYLFLPQLSQHWKCRKVDWSNPGRQRLTPKTLRISNTTSRTMNYWLSVPGYACKYPSAKSGVIDETAACGSRCILLSFYQCSDLSSILRD